jgi:hypothetical protein
MSFAPKLLHVAGSVSFIVAIVYDVFFLELPEDIAPTREKFGGHFKYLTFLNMCLQCLYFTICIFADFSKENSRICKLRDVMFASAAFPIGIFVGVIFWSLWAIDRELIFSVRFDGFFPAWLNHLMHTTVLPLQLGELFLCRHEYPSRALGVSITATLTMGYLIWLNVVYYHAGFWVYPVFKVLSPSVRPIFMIFCCLLGAVFYFIGESMTNCFWPKLSSGSGEPVQGRKGKKARRD